MWGQSGLDEFLFLLSSWSILARDVSGFAALQDVFTKALMVNEAMMVIWGVSISALLLQILTEKGLFSFTTADVLTTC